MSAVFELDEEGWNKRVADARLSGFDANVATDPGFWEGSIYGPSMDFMSGFARVGRMFGVTAGGTAGRAIDATREVGRTLDALEFDDDGRQISKPSPTITEAQDAIFRTTDEVANSAVEFWRPNAHEVGTAGRILGGLTGMAGPLAAGGGTPFVLVPTTQVDEATRLIDEGVDTTTANVAGIGQAAGMYAGFKLPFVGKTLAQRMATGAAGNVLLGAGIEGFEKELLEGRGYEELARFYDPLDFESRAIDALLGVTFGGLAHLQTRVPPSQRSAVTVAANARHFQQDTAPGIPADAHAMVTHQKAMAAALDALDRGEPVTLTPDMVDANYQPRPSREAPDNDTWRDVFGEDMPEAPRQRPEPGTEEFKQFLKNEIDTRPMPRLESLSKNPLDYIEQTTTSGVIPLRRIRLTKSDTAESGDNAVKRFAAAARGEIPKRAPVSLEIDENGAISVVDGNGTVTAMQRIGVQGVVGELRPSKSLLDAIDQAPAEMRRALAQAYENAARAKPALDSLTREIASRIGTPHDPRIPDALKGIARAIDKARDDYAGDASQLKDIARTTIVVDNYNQAVAALAELQKRGATGLRNWLDESVETRDGYRDIKANVKVGDYTAEVQINYPEMIAAKNSLHKLYEERRVLDGKTDGTAADAVRIAELDAQMRERYAAAWKEALSRLKASSDTSTPSSRANPSETERPSGTSNARTENPPSGVGRAATGTPSQSQNTGSLPKTGNAIDSSSRAILTESDSPAVAAVNDLLIQQDVMVPTEDANGNMVVRSGREMMAEARKGIKDAEEMGRGIEAAVSCFLTRGFDAG